MYIYSYTDAVAVDHDALLPDVQEATGAPLPGLRDTSPSAMDSEPSVLRWEDGAAQEPPEYVVVRPRDSVCDRISSLYSYTILAHPRTYVFRRDSPNTMILVPASGTGGALYHISVSNNCFDPAFWVTTVCRGGTAAGEYVGEFE